MNLKSSLIFITILIIFGLILTIFGGQFFIYPDSYEYFSIASLLKNFGSIDVHLNNTYWSTFTLLSRNLYSIILFISSTITAIDPQIIYKFINLGLFILSGIALLLAYKEELGNKKILVLSAFYLLSYSAIFWISIPTNDYLGLIFISLSILYTRKSKNQNHWIELLLLTFVALSRFEIVFLIAAIIVSKYKVNWKSLLIQIIALVFSLIVNIVLSYDRVEYVSFQLQFLTEKITISPTFLIIGLLVFLIVIVRFRKRILTKQYLIYLMIFMSFGFFFADNPDLQGTFRNLGFLLTKELPALLLIALYIYKNFRKTISSLEALSILGILFSFITYHFYFQHFILVLPLLGVVAIHSFDESILRYRNIVVLITILTANLIIGFLMYRIELPDTYSFVSNSLQIRECFDDEVVYTNIPEVLIPLTDNTKFEIIDNSDFDQNQSFIVDSQIEISREYNSLLIPNSKLILGTKTLIPEIRFNCN